VHPLEAGAVQRWSQFALAAILSQSLMWIFVTSVRQGLIWLFIATIAEVTPMVCLTNLFGRSFLLIAIHVTGVHGSKSEW
jgi:hypothetical protein